MMLRQERMVVLCYLLDIPRLSRWILGRGAEAKKKTREDQLCSSMGRSLVIFDRRR
jgi:hypothetical protein